jgi:hypothetical protein
MNIVVREGCGISLLAEKLLSWDRQSAVRQLAVRRAWGRLWVGLWQETDWRAMGKGENNILAQRRRCKKDRRENVFRNNFYLPIYY